jgi:hypothetical protein
MTTGGLVGWGRARPGELARMTVGKVGKVGFNGAAGVSAGTQTADHMGRPLLTHQDRAIPRQDRDQGALRCYVRKVAPSRSRVNN